MKGLLLSTLFVLLGLTFAQAQSASASCQDGVCTVTTPCEGTQTFSGSNARVRSASTNGSSSVEVYVDDKLVASCGDPIPSRPDRPRRSRFDWSDWFASWF